VTNKTPEENRGWWWVQRRKRESTSEQSTRQTRTGHSEKLDRKFNLRTFRNLITCYVARLSSPHAYIVLSQRGACRRTLGGSAKSELDTQCRIRDNP
jgi:hypothetical protein